MWVHIAIIPIIFYLTPQMFIVKILPIFVALIILGCGGKKPCTDCDERPSRPSRPSHQDDSPSYSYSTPRPSNSNTVASNKFTDARDGRNYGLVKIGTQVWMAENLNYAASGSVCYDEQESNCDKYGRLYNWATAMSVCPDGWHIPSDAEWTTLTDFVGGLSAVGIELKSTNGWSEDGNGSDTYRFAALPGGSGYSGGRFKNVGYHGYWWSASESSTNYAYGRLITYGNESARWGYGNKPFLFSVRCLKD